MSENLTILLMCLLLSYAYSATIQIPIPMEDITFPGTFHYNINSDYLEDFAEIESIYFAYHFETYSLAKGLQSITYTDNDGNPHDDFIEVYGDEPLLDLNLNIDQIILTPNALIERFGETPEKLSLLSNAINIEGYDLTQQITVYGGIWETPLVCDELLSNLEIKFSEAYLEFIGTLVPEPTSLILISIGALAFASKRRIRYASNNKLQ